MRGTGGEQLVVPLASILRPRVGYEQNKYSGNFYGLKIWASTPDPLTLVTILKAKRTTSRSPGHRRDGRAYAQPGPVEGGLG